MLPQHITAISWQPALPCQHIQQVKNKEGLCDLWNSGHGMLMYATQSFLQEDLFDVCNFQVCTCVVLGTALHNCADMHHAV